MKIADVRTTGSLNDLAIQLFQAFSRTEYALKAAGYHNGDGNAEANWQKFALAVEPTISNPLSLELKAAIAFILKAPPKKQVIVGGNIEWAVVAPTTISQADTLLQYVRRVRNNLFHGGKFNGHWFDPERSESLLRHSLEILAACVASVPKIKEAYDG